jgi:predicted transcriptional regulator
LFISKCIPSNKDVGNLSTYLYEISQENHLLCDYYSTLFNISGTPLTLSTLKRTMISIQSINIIQSNLTNYTFKCIEIKLKEMLNEQQSFEIQPLFGNLFLIFTDLLKKGI